MADPHSEYSEQLTSPADNGAAITPSDDTDLATFTRGLYVGVSGDVKVDLVSSGTVTFTAMAGGTVHSIRCKRVYSTGTDATDLVGVW